MSKEKIIIATIKEWNILNYFKLKERYSGRYDFHLINNKDELTVEYIQTIIPKYIFFPHWSWIIKENIYKNFNCVVFHMTDLPFGRGGSPFQNLIMNGVYDTKISALKVDVGVDTGDIYFKENVNIALGSAEENFIKISNIIFEKMIPKFLDEDIIPIPQAGDIVIFKRRNVEDSNLQMLESYIINNLYDFIRMLDADGYPKAYIKLREFKIEFSEVHLKNQKLVKRFEIIKNE